MMLPMGTIVTCCMIGGLLVAAFPTGSTILPRWFIRVVGSILLLAGLWNSLWHGLRHLGEFWGIAALVSGLVMILTALYLLIPDRLPGNLIKLKPLVLLSLLGFALLYAITIIRL